MKTDYKKSHLLLNFQMNKMQQVKRKPVKNMKRNLRILYRGITINEKRTRDDARTISVKIQNYKNLDF